jgi:hypothetical protein
MSGTTGSNPVIRQGTLNRLRASVIFTNFPALNVTSSFLGKRGISLSFQGDATVYIDTMTGAVTSPEPYMRVTMTMHLLKTQAFAQQFKTQLELLTLLGGATVRPDAVAMQPYRLSNCSIISPGDQDFSGADADYPVRIGGIYLVNSGLFSL